MSDDPLPAAGVDFCGGGKRRFRCARCGYSFDGVGSDGDRTRCPECGLEQRLDGKDYIIFSRADIMVVTIIAWLPGGILVAAGGDSPLVHFFIDLAILAGAPSLIIAILVAHQINRPAGLTPRGRVAYAVWWWFLGSMISVGVAAILMVPAFA